MASPTKETQKKRKTRDAKLLKKRQHDLSTKKSQAKIKAKLALIK